MLRPVDIDLRALEDLQRLMQQAGIEVAGVPTFVIGERLIIGFDGDAHTGRTIVQQLDGTPPPADTVTTPWGDTLSATRRGMPPYTLALGLLDGFAPGRCGGCCSCWRR